MSYVFWVNTGVVAVLQRALFVLVCLTVYPVAVPAFAGEWFDRLAKDPLATADRRVVAADRMEDRRAVRGLLRLSVVDYTGSRLGRDRLPIAAPELMRYMRDHTRIEARVGDMSLRLHDPAVFAAPVLYMTGNDGALRLDDAAKENLGRYLRGGGFLFAEEIRPSAPGGGVPGEGAGVKGTSFDVQFKALLADPLVLGRAGHNWQKVPRDHPLYYSYWDFADGPPLGGAAHGNVFDLEMLEVDGRVAVVFSDLNLSWYWGDTLVAGRERALQFGVNLMVYALTQPGGLVDSVRYRR